MVAVDRDRAFSRINLIILGIGDKVNTKQKNALLSLCSQEIDKNAFSAIYGTSCSAMPAEVLQLLKEAMRTKDAEGVEFALMLGSCFSFPDGILDLIHKLVVEKWHCRHEDMVQMLQRYHEASSIPALWQAIALKPKLKYLDYDDYGAYYKKCLWALEAIGTLEAVRVIEECATSPDPQLREQALYRHAKVRQQ
jgi:hypothetical protein